MPNRLRVSVVDHKADDVVDHKADDFTILLDALEQGLFSTSGMGTELLGPEGTALYSTHGMGTELRIDYTTIDGQLHATGFTLTDGGQITLRGTFSTPEPLGVAVWTDMRPDALGEALFGDTRFDIRGSRGDDAAIGSDFRDRFRMGGGDDSVFGGDGDDMINGGRGNDLLIGGAGDDTILGGGGNDMLVLGDGNTLGQVTARGGAGNDVFVQLNGQADLTGGPGCDVFIFNSFAGTAGGSPNIQTRIRDFDPDDILVLTGYDGTLPGDFAGETLADLENGTIDDFQWIETNRGVVIQAGDARIVLRGVDAEDINLDQILFTKQSVQEATTLFDSNSGGGTLGYFMEPWAVLDITHGPGGDSYIAFGHDKKGVFETWGGDITDFIPTGETVMF
jgi:Ca2+-binding RTX toxin-like protein